MYFSPSSLAFFDSQVLPDCRPTTDAVHNQIMDIVAQGGAIGVDENDDPVGIPPAAAPALTLATAFKQKLDNCNLDYDQAVNVLRGTYPFAETTTWPVQIKEAQSYDAWRIAGRVGDPPVTQFLSDLTAQRDARGIGAGLEDLVDRVLTNNNMYSPAMAQLTAARHSAEQALTVALTAEDMQAIQAVTWDFSLTPP